MSKELTEIWEQQEVAYGVWCYLNNSFATELVAAQGCDYVLIDLQHGVASVAQAIEMVRAAQLYSTNPLVRVPNCDSELIGKVLDGGASGVVMPMVEDQKTAARTVDACRYPPRGVRSYGPVRQSMLRGTMAPDTLADVAIVAMIETVKGVDAVDSIAQTPGLSAIYIGSVDLSIDLGIGPEMPSNDSRFVEAVGAIKNACERAGIVVGLHCPNGAVAGDYARAGYRMVTTATDIEILKDGVKSNLLAAVDAKSVGRR